MNIICTRDWITSMAKINSFWKNISSQPFPSEPLHMTKFKKKNIDCHWRKCYNVHKLHFFQILVHHHGFVVCIARRNLFWRRSFLALSKLFYVVQVFVKSWNVKHTKQESAYIKKNTCSTHYFTLLDKVVLT